MPRVEKRGDRFAVVDAADGFAEQRRDADDLDPAAQRVDIGNGVGGHQLLDLRGGQQFLMPDVRRSMESLRLSKSVS